MTFPLHGARQVLAIRETALAYTVRVQQAAAGSTRGETTNLVARAALSVLMLHAQPVVEVALRPEVIRGNEDAPAGPERPRNRDGAVGRVAVERDVHAARPPEQRQPRRLLAAGAVEAGGAGVPESGHEHRRGVRNPLAESHDGRSKLQAQPIAFRISSSSPIHFIR
jgi:hypothetical protein